MRAEITFTVVVKGFHCLTEEHMYFHVYILEIKTELSAKTDRVFNVGS